MSMPQANIASKDQIPKVPKFVQIRSKLPEGPRASCPAKSVSDWEICSLSDLHNIKS